MIKCSVACVLLLVVGVVVCSESKQCEEKEKSLALLDLAKDSITRAKEILPECEESNNSSQTNSSSCGKKEKTAAYIEVALQLIDEARENYPVCDTINIDQDKKPEEEPTEKPEEKLLLADCLEVFESGSTKSGVYTIQPRGPAATGNRTLDVYCDMDTQGGGWTVFQRRGKFTPLENFNRDWNTYKAGFGNISRDFWLGNENIYFLSNQGQNSVRFDLGNKNGEFVVYLYENFRIEDEQNMYRLHIGNFKGSDKDMMEQSNGEVFSTRDKNYQTGCAARNVGGWWFPQTCAFCNPNGLYQPGKGQDMSSACWTHWNYDNRNSYEGLSLIEMRLKRTGPVLN